MKTPIILAFNLLLVLGLAPLVEPAVLPQESGSAVVAPEPTAQEGQGPVIKIEIEEVTIPVTVTNPKGEFVIDLHSSDFRILDEDREQRTLELNPSLEPTSIAIVIETSSRVESLLTEIGRSGLSFTQLVIGETGEAAVIAFDSEVKVVQDFTENPDFVENALKDLKPGGEDVRLSDALWRAMLLLQRRPVNRRKVIVAISEARDNGSSNTPGSVLRRAQQLGISVYALTLSTAIGMLNRVGNATPWPFPSGVPARPVPSNHSPTPDTQTQLGAAHASLLPIIEELISSSKNLFVGNPLLFFAQGTGGEEFSASGNAMGHALSQIGRELRTQYLITYHPNNSDKPGFHRIRVLVNQPDLRVRTLPGYMLGPSAPLSPKSQSAPATNRQP